MGQQDDPESRAEVPVNGHDPSSEELSPDEAQERLTQLLVAWGDGDSEALDRLVPRVYSELRRLAERSLRRERRDHTFQATDLVNEAYLRLVRQDRIQWRNRAQFLGIAAELMRRVLVDHARKRHAAKRDGGIRMTLDEGLASSGSASREVRLVALDEALSRLAALDPRQARIVELRYFAGLTVDETAEVVGVSSRTVKREWQVARAWLKRELSRGEAGES